MKTSDIYDVFDSGGVLNSLFPGYEYREAQLMMSELVREAFEDNAVAVAEAGTGIGKSFAYLVPAILNLEDEPEDRVVIATATINLQRQLIEKDIPALLSAMGLQRSVVLVVGMSNYLCLNRLAEQISLAPLLSLDPTTEIGRMKAWAQVTDTGLRSDFPGRVDAELWSDVCVDGDLCLGYKCPQAQECHFLKARKQAMEAQILVVNHHILFTDARIRHDGGETYDEEALLPPFQRLVIDEAHNIEKNATEFFSDDYARSALLRHIVRLTKKNTGGKSNLLEFIASYVPDAKTIDRLLDEIEVLKLKVDTLDDMLVAFMRSRNTSGLLLRRQQSEIIAPLLPLSRDIAECGLRMSALAKRIVEEQNVPQEYHPLVRRFQVYINRINSLTSVLGKFADIAAWGDDIHWLDTESMGRKGNTSEVHIKITPLSVAGLLKEAVYSKLNTVVCTSATLNLEDDFQFWSSRVGLPIQGKAFLRSAFASPFDYSRNLMLLTPMDAPEFSERAPEEYIDYVAQSIGDAVLASGGGALVLFTSYAMMKEIHDRLESSFKKAGLEVACQGDADRYTLLQEFKNAPDSSLFATDSFWEGVDAPGDTLRLVVIVKLPFKVPTEPIYRARHEKIDAEGGSGFFQLALPEATMKLKQGFGRLLRSTKDRGVVLILDSRIVRKSYGPWMLRALPPSFHPEILIESIAPKIESFLFSS